MGSVQDFIECHQCKFPEAISDLDTHSYEETIFCPNCGFTFITAPRIDRKKSAQDTEKRQFFLKRKDGKIAFYWHQNKGYGTWKITNNETGIGKIGVMPKDETKRKKWILELCKLKGKGYSVKATEFSNGIVKRII